MANVHSTQNIAFFKVYTDIKEQRKEILKLIKKMLEEAEILVAAGADVDAVFSNIANLNGLIAIQMSQLQIQIKDERERNNPFFGFRRLEN